MSQTALNPLETTLSRLFNRRLRSIMAPWDLTPGQMTLVYLILAFVALYFSDVYLPHAIQDPALLVQVQALKGGVEIVATGGLIFVLTTRSRQALEKQTTHLDNLRAERDVLHRVFRHNLRQDITVILGYADLIRSDLQDDTLREHCHEIVQATDRIQGYQDKIVEIEGLLGPPTRYERVDLSELIREHSLVNELQTSDEVSVTLDLPERANVIAIPAIGSAIREIVKNVVQHNDKDDREIHIAIEENVPELVDLVVTDNGPGIPTTERQVIESMGEEDLAHSNGLGLWLSKLVCTVSGGDLTIPAEGEGGKVVLRFPAAYDQTLKRRVRSIAG